MEWYCNKCGVLTEEVDADVLYMERRGLSEAIVCRKCDDWWFTPEICKKIAKSEARAESKMA